MTSEGGGTWRKVHWHARPHAEGGKTWVGKNIGFYIFSFVDESDIVVVLVSPVGSSPRAAENDETERQLQLLKCLFLLVRSSSTSAETEVDELR